MAGEDHGVDGGVLMRRSRSRLRELDKPFLMPIEDVFTITGRGTVVTGKVEQGMVHTGDEIGDRRFAYDAEDGVHGCGDVPQVAGSGSGG